MGTDEKTDDARDRKVEVTGEDEKLGTYEPRPPTPDEAREVINAAEDERLRLFTEAIDSVCKQFNGTIVSWAYVDREGRTLGAHKAVLI